MAYTRRRALANIYTCGATSQFLPPPPSPPPPLLPFPISPLASPNFPRATPAVVNANYTRVYLGIYVTPHLYLHQLTERRELRDALLQRPAYTYTYTYT